MAAWNTLNRHTGAKSQFTLGCGARDFITSTCGAHHISEPRLKYGQVRQKVNTSISGMKLSFSQHKASYRLPEAHKLLIISGQIGIKLRGFRYLPISAMVYGQGVPQWLPVSIPASSRRFVWIACVCVFVCVTTEAPLLQAGQQTPASRTSWVSTWLWTPSLLCSIDK